MKHPSAKDRRRHDHLRKRWARQVAAGGVCCARCGLPIGPEDAFDLDHTQDRSGYLGVSHRYCNRSAGGRRRGRRGRHRWSRDWFA